MTIKKRFPAIVLALVLTASLLVGCGSSPSGDAESETSAIKEAYIDVKTLFGSDISDDTVALDVSPAFMTETTPVASGKLTRSNSRAAIDYSNTRDGYVMVKFSANSQKKIKAQVKGPSGTVYTYNLTGGAASWTTFPLSDGNGSYKVTVYENISGTSYASVISASFTAKMTDEFAPFIRPNQYVDYSAAPKSVAKAAELTKGITDPLDKVKVVYDYVVNNISYDYAKAKSVKSGYLPVLDNVLAEKKGICFDYASLMTGMLRSQAVPCKLVVGYVGNAYHAWISVWSEETGWVNAAIYFDGNAWQRMDPTFASSGNQSQSIMKYIGDGTHYNAKYIY